MRILQANHQVHPFEPVWDADSRLLILGSFPSVLSRQQAFYYGNPRNRFWEVLGKVFDSPVPRDVPKRREWLLRHGIALWDVLASCEIRGSSDASIQHAVVHDLAPLLEGSRISHIWLNGSTAGTHYRRHMAADIGLPAAVLPSTSPANAAWSLQRLVSAWQVINPNNDEGSND